MKMNTFDLQIQTSASDGKHSPREIVAMAKDRGLQVIAITDHDTVAAVEEAIEAGRELGVRVIAGIEISVEEKGAHILGYGIDHQSSRLGEFTERFREERVLRLKKIMENLRKNEGFAVEWEDVLKEAGEAASLTSPHLVYAVMKNPENKEKLVQDEVKSKPDFYNRYLVPGGPNDEKREHFSAKQAIDLIRGLGGVSVWSHPAVHFRPLESRGGGETDYEALENFLKELIGWGIDGVEIFNPAHTEDDTEFINSLAEKYKLMRTAGSDFHEKGDHPRDPETGLHSADKLGDYDTYGFSTEDILQRLDEAITGRRKQLDLNRWL